MTIGNTTDLLNRFRIIVILIWSTVLLTSLISGIWLRYEQTVDSATARIYGAYQKDLIYRRWNSMHGGVYVEIDSLSPPNPFLKVPEREIELESGRKLTLVNPAYMNRQVSKLHDQSNEIWGRLVSDNPLNPDNHSDAWENEALKKLAQDIREVTEFSKIGDEYYLRILYPFYTEKSCLRCHAEQGYRLGQLRGGISFAIPLQNLTPVFFREAGYLALIHFILGGLALVGMMIMINQARRVMQEKEQLAESARQNAEMFRNFVNFTYDWEYMLDKAGNIVYMSPSCERISGYSPYEFIKNADLLKRITHPDDREQVTRHDAKAHPSNMPDAINFRIIDRNGEEVWLGHVCQPVHNENGEIVGRRISNRDITREVAVQESLRENQRMMRTLLSNLPGMAYRCQNDRHRTMEFVSQGCVELTGYTHPELIANKVVSFNSLVYPMDSKRILKLIRVAVENRQPFRENYRIRTRNNELKWVWEQGQPIFDKNGNLQAIEGFIIDITDEHRAQQEITQLNKNLESRIRERTQQLEVMNKELESFSYSVSNDLKAPLHIIDGFTTAIEEDYEHLLDAEGREYLDRIRSGVNRMGQLIDDLLKLSRMTRTEISLSEIDISAITSEIAAGLKSNNPTRTVQVDIKPGITIHADRHLMTIVMQNLLDNAWKFTANTEAPHIEFGQCSDAETDKNTIRLYLRDNGAGFDNEYADKLFGAFQRLHRAADYPGTGIGLATVARIIHRHGGSVAAKGEVDKGAIFYISLPKN